MSTLRAPAVRFYDVQREMNRFLDSFFPTSKRRTDEDGPESAVWRPIVDVHEDDLGFVIDVELPGIQKESTSINFQDGTLTVSGERGYSYDATEQPSDGSSTKAHRLERLYGKFLRSFTFPAAINAEAITAKFEHGVLKIMVPKAEEIRPKQIEIK